MALLADHIAAIEEVASRVESPAEFERCGAPFQALVRDHRCVYEALNRTLGHMLDQKGYSPRDLAVQWRSDGVKLATQISLEERKTFTLVASLQHDVSRNAFTAPGGVHMALLSEKPIGYTLYTLPAHYRNDVFEELQLEHAGRHRLLPLGSVFLDASKHVAVFDEGEEAVLIKLQSPSHFPYEWAFDLDTLRAWQITSTVLQDTQLVHVAETLASLGNEGGAQSLEILLAHPRHHVRWGALQAIGHLDGDRMKAHLVRAREDEHPHLRAAARAEARRLFGAEAA
jgi:hypothetical protein